MFYYCFTFLRRIRNRSSKIYNIIIMIYQKNSNSSVYKLTSRPQRLTHVSADTMHSLTSCVCSQTLQFAQFVFCILSHDASIIANVSMLLYYWLAPWLSIEMASFLYICQFSNNIYVCRILTWLGELVLVVFFISCM